jgi:diguanylate cyclase (GGDEF)-like protein/putative nucleotidyltransferase with HDIG domain
MSAANDSLPLSGAPETTAPAPERELTLPARLFLALTACGAAAAVLPLVGRVPHARDWGIFLVLASAAALAQLFPARTPRDQTYATAVIFLVAGALLLPPELVALMATVQLVPEWLRLRYRWYLQTFNICNWTIALLAGWGVAHLVKTASPFAASEPTTALAGLAAITVVVAANHTILAVMLRLARGHSLRQTGLFSFENLSTELGLAALGVAVATLWVANPWLVPFALAPLVFMHRSLRVPLLQEAARIDAKTGLFNARHFSALLREELVRAERFQRPASLIMADLDLLRDINNSYGHLAGDSVLAGIAEVFQTELRDYDVPARFGGEEFAILLPETSYDHALEVAERIRAAVAARSFEVHTANEPITATISMGVASFPQDASDPNELVHRADLAVYRAKLQGRNRVIGAADESTPISGSSPHLELLPAEEAAQVRQVERRRRRRRVPAASDRRQGAKRGSGRLALSRMISLLPKPRREHANVVHADQSAPLWDDAATHSPDTALAQMDRLLRERSLAAMESLSAAIEARDAYTAGHSRRVQQLALAIGRKLGLPKADLELLGHAALFHDIGKLAIPDAILLKPDRLDANEWDLMRRHSAEGARIIERLSFLSDAVAAIRHHHERFDGTGYPDRLAGEEIPLSARIIHVADAWDSMLTMRIYQPALNESDALEELRSGVGTQFCPRCADALESILPQTARQSPVKLVIAS